LKEQLDALKDVERKIMKGSHAAKMSTSSSSRRRPGHPQARFPCRLSAAGHGVREAESGEKALALLATSRP